MGRNEKYIDKFNYFGFTLYSIAHSEKTHHSTDVVLKVEADARPIKAGKKQSLHPASRNTVKTAPKRVTPKTTLDVARTLKESVTRKTASAVSRNPQRDSRVQTSSSLSFLNSKRAPQKLTPIRSRSPRNDRISVSEYSAHSSLVTKAIKNPSTQSVTNASLGAKLYPSPWQLGHQTHPVNFNALSRILVSLPNVASGPERTSVAFLDKSKAPSVTLHSLVKMEPSTMNDNRKLLSNHSTGLRMTTHIPHFKPSPVRSPSSVLRVRSETSSDEATHSKGTASTTNDQWLCRESPVSHDISPPSGTSIALGPVPDMRTCIHLSCDVGGGDVAYMLSLQCFLITCDKPEMCKPGQLSAGGIDSNVTQVAFLRKRDQSAKGKLVITKIDLALRSRTHQGEALSPRVLK